MLYGVDVHGAYQAGISFPTLARQGYSFAAVKASEGTGFRAPNFGPWIAAIRAAGLIPGAYHWIKAGDGAAQARFFHSIVTAAGGPTGMLIQLDCEDNAGYADVQAWAAEWRRLTNDHPFLIYTGGWWWRPRGWNGAAVTPYLWDSHYLTADADTAQDDPATFAGRIPSTWWNPGYGGWSSATFVQFSSRGDAGGLGNNVDLNATKLTMDQLRALARFDGPVIPQRGDDDMAEIMVTVIDGHGGVWLSNYQTYRAVGGGGEYDFHTRRGVPEVKVKESELPRYGVPVAAQLPVAAVALSDADRAAIVAGVRDGLQVPTAAEVADLIASRLAQ